MNREDAIRRLIDEGIAVLRHAGWDDETLDALSELDKPAKKAAKHPHAAPEHSDSGN